MSQSRAASLGRSPSADHVKRRKSWQAYDNTQKGTPDVRTILGKDAAQRAKLRGNARQKCAALPWPEILSAILTTLAVIATAALILVVLAIVFHSSVAYSRWVEVRDGTAYYVQEINRVQTVLLVGTFCGTVLIVLGAYALLMFITRKLEARKANKKSVGLDDIAERDLEQGDAQLKTKQNISKLMSDAEKQYVAEYIKKSAPAGILRKQQPGVGAVPSNTVQDKITVQKLESGPQEAQGYLPPRSWSLKRMLTIGRSDAERFQPDTVGIQERNTSFDWNKPPSSEVAAQLSSPDAFNRASSSHATVVSEDSSRRSDNAKQDFDAMRPSTPKMGELARQRRDTPEAGSTPDDIVGNTRIMVTKPIEAHGEGSANSDTEEEEFDRERQHSVLPHPATEPPFSAQILTRFPRQGLEAEEPSTSAGWQDVGLESDDEGVRAGLGSGHMYSSPTGLYQQRSGEVKAAERLTMIPLSAHTGPETQIRCYLSVELEEVLPRPQAGLLNRLLRLARVDRVKLPGLEPAFVIQPGKEYMMGLKLRHPGTGQARWHAKWVRIQLPDGQPVRFNVEESSNKPQEWVGSACWDTCLHSSEMLAGPSKSEKPDGVTISMTVGLEDPAAALSKVEAHGVMHIMPQQWLRSKGGEEASPPLKASSVASFCLF